MENSVVDFPTWIFPLDTFKALPSFGSKEDNKTELIYRQSCAHMINYAGCRLKLTQLVSNTAIVFMHRFYMFQQMELFSPKDMAPVFLFLATKIEEQLRYPKQILLAFNIIKAPIETVPVKEIEENEKKLFINEKVLVQTLGFEFMINHPHIFIVKAMDVLKLQKEICQTAYFFASCSLHLTYFCVQLKSSYIAAICIKLACMWSKRDLKDINGQPWWHSIDKDLNLILFDSFITYFDKVVNGCSSKLKGLLIKFSVYNKEGSILQYTPPLAKIVASNPPKVDNNVNNSTISHEINTLISSSINTNLKNDDISSSTLAECSVQPVKRTNIMGNSKRKKKKPVPTPQHLQLLKTNEKQFDFF